MATDKAKYITGFTKIVRTAANKAANECEELVSGDCCDNASIDVTFSGLTDCGACYYCCADLNGNTYECAYDAGPGGGLCTWSHNYTGSNGEVWALVRIDTSTGALLVQGGYILGGEHKICFESDGVETITSCDDIPISNIANTASCGGIVVGDDGTADLDWT